MRLNLPEGYMEKFAEQVRAGISQQAYVEHLDFISLEIKHLPHIPQRRAQEELTELRVFGQLLLDDEESGREVTSAAILRFAGWIADLSSS
jgi:hypothetical protein